MIMFFYFCSRAVGLMLLLLVLEEKEEAKPVVVVVVVVVVVIAGAADAAPTAPELLAAARSRPVQLVLQHLWWFCSLTSILSMSSVAVGAETRMLRPATFRNPSSTALSKRAKSGS
jgi:hypothetical protein